MNESVLHALLSGTTVAAVAAVGALALLLYVGHNRERSPYWYPMVFWVAHGAAFYVSNVTVRVFFDYGHPTVLFSSWGVIIFLQAFISILGVTLLKIRMDG